MTIASEITRIEGACADIENAIKGKDVDVPAGTKITGYADLIGQISGGGGEIDWNKVGGFINDDNLVLRIYYYDEIYEYAEPMSPPYNMTITYENKEKLANFIKTHPSGSMQGELNFEYDTNQNSWFWMDPMEHHYMTDAELLEQAGVIFTRIDTSSSAYCSLINRSKPLATHIATFDIVNNNYLAQNMENFNGWWQDEQEFYYGSSWTCIKIKASTVVEIRFGTCGNTETIPEESRFHNFVPSSFKNLRRVNGLPTHILYSNPSYMTDITFTGMREFNGDICFLCRDTGQYDHFGLYQLPNFNANIFYPYARVVNGLYDMPNMTGAVYFGENFESFEYPEYVFTTTNATDPVYAHGVTFWGPGAVRAKALVPDSDVSPYRKILLAE